MRNKALDDAHDTSKRVEDFVTETLEEEASYNHYYGQFHSHTVYVYLTECKSCDPMKEKKCSIIAPTHAQGCPKEAYECAKNEANMDFLFLTEHSNSFTKAMGSWEGQKRIADTFTRMNPGFIAARGFEMTYAEPQSIGHLNTFNTSSYTTRFKLGRYYNLSYCMTQELIDMGMSDKKAIELWDEANKEIDSLNKEIKKLETESEDLNQRKTKLTSNYVEKVQGEIREEIRQKKVEKGHRLDNFVKIVRKVHVLSDEEEKRLRKAYNDFSKNSRKYYEDRYRKVMKVDEKTGKPGVKIRNGTFEQELFKEYEKAKKTKNTGRLNKLLYLEEYYSWISSKENSGSITQWNHPDPEKVGNFFDFLNYEKVRDSICLLEAANFGVVINEDLVRLKTETRYYEQYNTALRKGWRVAPSFNQDNHNKGWGTVNDFRTVVLMPDKRKKVLKESIIKRVEKEFKGINGSESINKKMEEFYREADYNLDNLYEAIRRRHVYATDFKDVRLEFCIKREKKNKDEIELIEYGIMGDIINIPKAEKDFIVYVRCTSNNFCLSIQAIKLIGDNGTVMDLVGNFDGKYGGYTAVVENTHRYLYVLIELSGSRAAGRTVEIKGGIAITAPIWVNRT